MRKMFLCAVLAASTLILSVSTSLATPGRGTCSGCHPADSRVTVAATFQGCSGTNATYNVSVSDIHDNGEGWAVFSGTTNTVNGYYPASSSFSVAAGRSYTVRGVSDGANRGGSAAITIAPVCNSCTPVPENCTDGVDNDCDGAIDCRDGNCAANPACIVCVPVAEVCADALDNDCALTAACTDGCTPTGRSERRLCGDGIDNDCDGRSDCQDRDCRRNVLCR